MPSFAALGIDKRRFRNVFRDAGIDDFEIVGAITRNQVRIVEYFIDGPSGHLFHRQPKGRRCRPVDEQKSPVNVFDK